jgi:hypothetical protein
LKEFADNISKCDEIEKYTSDRAEKKTLWEKEKLLIMSNFFLSRNAFQSCLQQTGPMSLLFGNGLK